MCPSGSQVRPVNVVAHSPVTFRLEQPHLETPMCCTIILIFYKCHNVKRKIGKHRSTVTITEGMKSRKSSWREKEPVSRKPKKKTISRKRGKQQCRLQLRSQEEWGLRKGHWVYNCRSSFFMSSKQLIQKGSVGLKGTRKKVNLMPEKAKQKNVKRYQERFTSKA